jgi:hypothetical protein
MSLFLGEHRQSLAFMQGAVRELCEGHLAAMRVSEGQWSIHQAILIVEWPEMRFVEIIKMVTNGQGTSTDLDA